jgi:heme/copper-type cytochrome/quinol oxidase subunit 2
MILLVLKNLLLSIYFSNILLLFAQVSITETWVRMVFYSVLVLTSIGFVIVVGLQIKAFFSKEKVDKEKTFESIWTAVPLIVLIALWWFF